MRSLFVLQHKVSIGHSAAHLRRSGCRQHGTQGVYPRVTVEHLALTDFFLFLQGHDTQGNI